MNCKFIVSFFQTTTYIIIIEVSVMSKRLRLVPVIQVLAILTICQERCLESQFCQADQHTLHYTVTIEKLFDGNLARHCTDFQSCEFGTNMTSWTSEQKVTISNLYKTSRKIVKSKSHVEFLNECLSSKIIPKCFKINKVIPGNLVEIQEKFRKISFESMQSEKVRFENELQVAESHLVHLKTNLQ